MKVTLIRPDGCAHCVAVKGILGQLKDSYPTLEVEEIDMTSDEGQKLVAKYKIMASPGILINDEFFAMGGATKAQFEEKFKELE